MNADEMFEKLGYDIKKDDGKVISFEKPSSSRIWDTPAIIFDKISKLIIFYDIDCLSMRTLQALNKKCEEMGWLDEDNRTIK
jgi:hypothetical protein